MSAAVADAVRRVRRARRRAPTIRSRQFFECFAGTIDDDDGVRRQCWRRTRATSTGVGQRPLDHPAGADGGRCARHGRRAAKLGRHRPTRRATAHGHERHDGWSVSSWRGPLGVVGFVFEGRPERVRRRHRRAAHRATPQCSGSAATRWARRGRSCVVRRAGAARRRAAGGLRCSWSTSPPHAAGWALFADARLASRSRAAREPAVAQLGAVARQHGVPVSLHGTGGAWLVAVGARRPAALAGTVEHSLDRKVCNTLNVCCMPRSHSRAVSCVAVAEGARIVPLPARGTEAVVHRVGPTEH